MIINIDENIKLELLAPQHAAGLYAAVDANRAHLSEFLPWVDKMQSVHDFQMYIQHCIKLYHKKKEVSFAIMLHEVPCGRIGLHHLNMQNKNAAVGYWLTKAAEGKGIITRSCKALIAYGFEELNLHRIVINAAVNNVKSRAVAEKLNFKKEGILRAAELVNNQLLDLAIYSMLRNEWMDSSN